MAYTKVFAIRARLDDRVKYAINGDKTELGEKINYAADLQKTNSVRFVSALNCKSAETAFAAMRRTKEKFCKTGGVLGYHFIQSFAPGEVTPEQAHEIGCEFARRLVGEDFEVVVGTHLDKAHPHNHIIVNSVSRIDGHKYHSSPESYYNDVRGTSDELCRENNLSVIAPRGKGKHYAEWKAEQVGKPTVRGVIRADIDTIIQQAYTYDSFLMLLRKNGYDSISIDGQAADWVEVLAVFAVKVAGSDDVDAADVATMDADRIARLKAVFWDMTIIAHRVEVIHHPGSGESDDGWTERNLHITIAAKTAEEMKTVYHFSRNQVAALAELLEQRDLLLELIEDVYSVSGDTASLIRGLPEDLSPEREAVVRTACSLVGKVNYFWGGKSLVIGWDARWGELRQVTAAGSSTTGTYRPYGLDCSGCATRS